MKIEKIAPGQVVFEIRKQKAGNTTLTTVAVYSLRVTGVDAEKGVVLARWNGNPERKYYRQDWLKWKAKAPVLVRFGFGIARLATKAEKAELKAAEESKKIELQ